MAPPMARRATRRRTSSRTTWRPSQLPYSLRLRLNSKNWDVGIWDVHRVLGTRARGHASAGRFDHSNGSGYVAPHAGDYHDAIDNRKATVHLRLISTRGATNGKNNARDTRARD